MFIVFAFPDHSRPVRGPGEHRQSYGAYEVHGPYHTLPISHQLHV